MKHGLILIFVMSLGCITAQVTFHVSVARLYKMSFNDLQATVDGTAIQSNERMAFPDFTIYQTSHTFSQPKRLSLGVGLSFKKHRLDLGILNDGVSNKYFIRLNTYDPILGKLIQNEISGTSRSNENRLYLNYDYKVINKPKKTNLFVSFSLGFCYRSGRRGVFKGGTLGEVSLLNNSGKTLTATSEDFTAFDTYTFNVGAGIGTDLHIKNYYILTLSANFTYSPNNLYLLSNRISVADFTGVKSYEFKMLQLCSGLYFSISRRFQFYPWKPIKSNPIWLFFKPEKENGANL